MYLLVFLYLLIKVFFLLKYPIFFLLLIIKKFSGTKTEFFPANLIAMEKALNQIKIEIIVIIKFLNCIFLIRNY